jgi:hypothetical protein
MALTSDHTRADNTTPLAASPWGGSSPSQPGPKPAIDEERLRDKMGGTSSPLYVFSPMQTRFQTPIGEVGMMRRPIARATGAAAALLAAHVGAASASAASAPRPLPAELTRQLTQPEREQLHSGDASAYSRPRAYHQNRQQLRQPGTVPPPVGTPLPPPMGTPLPPPAGTPPPQPGGAYPPH